MDYLPPRRHAAPLRVSSHNNNDNDTRVPTVFFCPPADFGFARYLQSNMMAATLCGSPMYMVSVLLCPAASEVVLRGLGLGLGVGVSIAQQNVVHASLALDLYLFSSAPSGPRGHHVSELRRQGRLVEHRHGHLPVSGWEATVPGECSEQPARECARVRDRPLIFCADVRRLTVLKI